MELAREQQLVVEERPFSRAEALSAREVWLTSASNFVMPVVEVYGTAIGDGRPGPLARRLRADGFQPATRRLLLSAGTAIIVLSLLYYLGAL